MFSVDFKNGLQYGRPQSQISKTGSYDEGVNNSCPTIKLEFTVVVDHGAILQSLIGTVTMYVGIKSYIYREHKVL